MNGKWSWLAAMLCAMVLAAAPLEARERVEDSGDVLYVAMPLAALGLTLARRDRDGSIQFGKSLAVAGVATGLTKEMVNKRRPDGTDDVAFVSGHSAAAFLSAGFIHRRYGIRDAWPAYVFASYVGWTRIYAHQHDLIDVLGGAAVGVGTAFWLSERIPETMDAAVTPAPGGDGLVLRFTGAFGPR